MQSTQNEQGTFAGVGFNIMDEHGAPVVTFGFLNPFEAANARSLIEKAIVDAAMIAVAAPAIRH
jgi:hypothetical protein